MGSSTQLGRVFGIPIKVHITLWILLPLIALNFTRGIGSSLIWGVLAAVGLFASVALHELGHSFVALRKGCRVREILLLPIGGMAQLDRMPQRPADEFQVAIAGPVVSFALFLFFSMAGVVASVIGLKGLTAVLTVLGAINLMLAIFNLLPSFPMDGGRIFRAWMTPRVGRLEATRIAAKIGRIMAVIFGILGFMSGNFILVAIAIFIYMAAGAEYRMVQLQEGSAPGAFGFWARPQDRQAPDWGIHVGPAPYDQPPLSEKLKNGARKTGSWFEDLYRDWR